MIWPAAQHYFSLGLNVPVMYSMHCQCNQAYSGNTSQPTVTIANRHHQLTETIVNRHHQPTETIVNRHHQPQTQKWLNITILHQLPHHKILLQGLSHQGGTIH
jgi:hypothetical protein